MAHKLVYYAVATGAVCAGVLSLPRLFRRLARRRDHGGVSALSLVMSFLLGFFLEATIGMIGFWFLEVSSLLFVYMLFSFFFSGHMFPIDMLPGVWRTDRATDRRCNTWPIFPRPCSWARSRGRTWSSGWRSKPAGSCFSSLACRVAWRLGVTALQRLWRMNVRTSRRCVPDDCDLADLRPASLPTYPRVFLTFARNSLVRDMTFRCEFHHRMRVVAVLDADEPGLLRADLSQYTPTIGAGTGWGKYQFFVFLATTLFINSVVQAFFMPNADEFSELIRTGGLDFALLKPIDTQFLVSLQKDRMVVAVELRLCRRACWSIRWCSWTTCPSAGADRALSAATCSAAWRSLQPDDRAGRDQRVAGQQSERCTTSGSTSPTFPAIRWRSTRARSARRCGRSSRS